MPQTVRTYDELGSFLTMFKNQTADLVVLRGPPGVGKTYEVREVMSGTDYVWITSHLSPLECYQKLWEAAQMGGAPVVIDDIDQLINNPSLVSIFKQAGGSGSGDSNEKVLQWNSTTNQLDDNIDKEFTTTSNLMIVANELNANGSLNKAALMDRGFVLDFEPFDEELLDRMSIIVEKSSVKGAGDVLDVIEKHMSNAERISLRTLVKGLQLKHHGGAWKHRLLKEMVGEEYAAVSTGLAENELVKDAATYYQGETWKSRSSFFRKRKEFNLDDNGEPK